MLKERVTSILYPLITFVVVIAAWEAAVDAFHVSSFVLPPPRAVAAALYAGFVGGSLWPHLLFTTELIVTGYVVGCSIALALGAALAESRTFEKFVYPLVVALQSTPKVALAPLIVVWFGYGLLSKVVLVALICFFPVFVNTLVGIRRADPNQLDLLRVFSASRLHIFLNVKLPSALGSIFAGLQISVVLGIIGAVVGEFMSSREGLGFVIQSSSFELNIGMMFASVITLTVIGMIGIAIVRFVHARVVFWEGETTGRANVAAP